MKVEDISFRPLSGTAFLKWLIGDIIQEKVKFPSPLGDCISQIPSLEPRINSGRFAAFAGETDF